MQKRYNNISGFEQEMLTLLPAIARMSCLKRLDIGGSNFMQLRKVPQQTLATVILEIVKLVNDDDTV
jgi:hypothetical protein